MGERLGEQGDGAVGGERRGGDLDQPEVGVRQHRVDVLGAYRIDEGRLWLRQPAREQRRDRLEVGAKRSHALDLQALFGSDPARRVLENRMVVAIRGGPGDEPLEPPRSAQISGEEHLDAVEPMLASTPIAVPKIRLDRRILQETRKPIVIELDAIR